MISFLHTSPVHIATFDALMDELAPGMVRQHRVEEGWLVEAQSGMTTGLSDTIVKAMRELAAPGVGVCTCSTIGAIAESATRHDAPVIRIDRALMEAALAHGSRPLVAMCLDSTRAPTLSLLTSVARKMGLNIIPQVVMCDGAWTHFQSGDANAYAHSIADTIKTEMSCPDSIVLAQGSMAIAEPLLTDTGVPVLSSPRLGVIRALELMNRP